MPTGVTPRGATCFLGLVWLSHEAGLVGLQGLDFSVTLDTSILY